MQSSGGSTIPAGFPKITLILVEPIFVIEKTTTIIKGEAKIAYPIILIGEGSYAQVFKYKDDYYNKYFVIKRAKQGLSTKELERFKLEFEEMKKLESPYIVEVYRYNDEKHEYIMEYVDETLYDYIRNNNTKLTKENRKLIVYQILKAFDYIHSRGLLHRDVSLTNAMIKHYDGLDVIKISDFGLVKTEENNLTSLLTELKGSLNDPDLEIYGFKNYKITHETYALTRLIYFIMTGRTRIEKFENEELKVFVSKGLDKDLSNRYQSVPELREAFTKL